MRLFYSNLIDASDAVISATSELSTLPASNVAHEFRSLVWRTGASVAEEAVIFDFGTAKAVTACIILDHTLTGSDTLIRVQGHTSNSWGSPSFSQTLTYSADAIAAVFASQSYRWWRVTFTKSAAGETRDVGRIFLGTYYETDDAPDYDGYSQEMRDLSRQQESIGGQTWTEPLPQYCLLRCDFSQISDTMMTAFKTYFASVGTRVSHFVQVATSSPWADYWYVKLSKPIKADVAAQDSSPVWNTTLEFKEQL